MTSSTLDAATLARRHLLALPGDLGHDEVEALAVSRFPRAAWEVEPAPATRSSRAPRPGVLRLSRLSTLVGPYALDRAAVHELGLPTSAGQAFVIEAPVERGEAPWPGGGDRTGFGRAFPHGLPVRDEQRVLDWALAAARRLGGTLRVVAEPDGPGVVLTPDPAAAVDLTVWSHLWLEPDAALVVMRRAIPRARLNLPDDAWSGPAVHGAVPGTEVLTTEQRRALHEAADVYDRAALEEPQPMYAFGALADLDVDGVVALEITGETDLPPTVAGLPWASRGAVAYRVRWEPPDLEDLESEHPPPQHRVARGRATPLVVAVARAVHATVGGEITDAMDFLVDPADL